MSIPLLVIVGAEDKKSYQAQWRQSNPDKIKAIQARYDAKHSEKKKAWKRGSENYKRTERDRVRNARRIRRLAAIEALGGKCCRCGFDNEQALQFDHKTPLMRRKNGLRDRSGGLQLTEFKSILAKEDHDIQLLCANCHAIKSKTEDQIHIIKGDIQ